MIGKKVRVFWPLDEQWYVGVVKEYDASSGEHLLKYPDGDTEWVKIGDTQQQMEGLACDSAGADALQSPPRILSKTPQGGALHVPSMESPDRIGRDYAPPPSFPPYPIHGYSSYGSYQGVRIFLDVSFRLFASTLKFSTRFCLFLPTFLSFNEVYRPSAYRDDSSQARNRKCKGSEHA
jgi:hypothetical protein